MPTDKEIDVSLKVAAAKKIIIAAESLESVAPEMGALEPEARKLSGRMREFGTAAREAAYSGVSTPEIAATVAPEIEEEDA